MSKIVKRSAFLLALLGGFVSGAQGLRGQETPVESDWTVRLKNAANELNVADLPDVEKARQNLRTAIAGLEQYMQPATNPNGAKWLEFLHWSDLQAAVDKPDATATEFHNLEARFKQNYEGLELAPLAKVRDALSDMAHAIRYGKNSDQTMGLLKRRLEQLDDHLKVHPTTEELERTRDIGLLMVYLWESHQAPQLRSFIREQHSESNMQIIVGQELANKVIGRPVHEVNPVDEVILGTHLTGSSLLVGQLQCRFVPNSHSAQFNLIMDGDFSSDNIGHNRGVRLTSRGNANVHVERRVTIANDGFLGGERLVAGPTCIDTDFCSTIDSISHRSQLVRKIAVKRAAKTKSQADAIAEGRLQRRITNQFTRQVDEQLAETNGDIGANKLPIFNRLGLARPASRATTSADKLHMYLDHSRPHQLAATAPCPLPEPEGDLVVRLHQSVVMNYGDSVLGGRIIRSEELPALAKQIFGKVPEELARPEDERPWSITMANYHPVELELRDGKLAVTVRLSRMERGDQTLDEPLTITAQYVPESVDGNLQLARQGEVKIAFVNKETRGTRAVTLQAFLKGKFDKLFRERLLDKPIDANEPAPMLASMRERFPNLPDLKVAELKMEQGWMQAVLR